jgi:uncharacterized delta-60 repeat protein
MKLNLPLRHVVRASVLALVCVVVFANPAHAVAGDLDGFGFAGKVVTPIVAGNARDFAHSVALHNGRFVVAGACELSNIAAFCVAQYEMDGALDNGFGEAGKVITPVSVGGATQTQSAVVQSDGKIVVAAGCNDGNGGHTFCLVRYTHFGLLDLSFNGTGMTFTDVGGVSANIATSVALQADGKIVVAGRCRDSAVGRVKFCIARYDDTGQLDGGFNGSGKLVTSISDGEDAAESVLVQPDGKIVVAGRCIGLNGDVGFCLARYTELGQLDPGFNTVGTVLTQITSNAAAFSIALQPDGKIVAAGTCFNAPASASAFCVARYRSDGQLDPSFNNTGVVTTTIVHGGAVTSLGRSVAIQPDGKIVVAGQCFDADARFCLARYRSDGALDTSFNGGTLVSSPKGFAQSVVVQPDHKIVVAGFCSGGVTNIDFCLARFDGGSACTLDIDGDDQVLATTDMLIGTRIALGMTGVAVTNDINFPANASRRSWLTIRGYLIDRCGMTLPP